MSTYQREHFPLPTPGRLKRELRLPRPPLWMVSLLALIVVGTWFPLVLINRARRDGSPLPRVHLILDMDKQPRLGPQASHPWFVDGRGMRQPVEGTIARGKYKPDSQFERGYFTKTHPESGAEQIEFVRKIPEQMALNPNLINRGRQRFEIYCAVCHGSQGLGNGPVNQRAIELKEPKWVPATNLMTQDIRDRPAGQLFQAISDGVRNMPPYAVQINVRDRWAIVAYVRDLQSRSAVAPPDKK